MKYFKMAYQTIKFDVVDQIAIITINRPDKLNALSKIVFDELEIIIDTVVNDSSIKSAIITGSGDKAFVAGADISELEGLNSAEGSVLARRGQLVFEKIEKSPKLFVAAINGYALGGGCELAMACHIRVASENAKFGQPEVNLGLLPGYGGTFRLTQLIGKGRAVELLTTGSMIDAITAFNFGLVNHVVTADQLLVKAKSILAIANTKAPLAIAACIHSANNANQVDSDRAYLQEAHAFGTLLQSADSKEGIRAFIEKRKAYFTGK